MGSHHESQRPVGMVQSWHLELVLSLDCKQRSLLPWDTEGLDTVKKFLTATRVMARRKL